MVAAEFAAVSFDRLTLSRPASCALVRAELPDALLRVELFACPAFFSLAGEPLLLLAECLVAVPADLPVFPVFLAVPALLRFCLLSMEMGFRAFFIVSDRS